MALPGEEAARHHAVAGRFGRLVAATNDWDAPSPVAGWVARDVVDHLVPELDRRGRTAPKAAPGTTLRERLGSGAGARLAADHVGSSYRR